MTAQEAIDRSCSHNETVHLDYDASVHADLLVECEDNTDSNTEAEFWGTTDSGNSWRVHMRWPE